MSDAKIRIRGLTKAFGAKTVLDGIDLDVASGTSMVVIGGSGSGKSVLLKCILGLIEPDAGTIEIDGRDVLRLPRQEREQVNARIGMLFQAGALFDSLTVWENVAFGLLAQHKAARAEARQRAGAILAQVGLDPSVGDLSPAELSGGMQKRVGLARAIAGQPDILFFDEPTTGLDRADRGLREAPGQHGGRDHPRHGERDAHRRPGGDAVPRQAGLAGAGGGPVAQRKRDGGPVHPWTAGRADPDGAAAVSWGMLQT